MQEYIMQKQFQKRAILNINLIFLQPYCLDLNPIENIWCKIKSEIYKSIYKNLNELVSIFK